MERRNKMLQNIAGYYESALSCFRRDFETFFFGKVHFIIQRLIIKMQYVLNRIIFIWKVCKLASYYVYTHHYIFLYTHTAMVCQPCCGCDTIIGWLKGEFLIYIRLENIDLWLTFFEFYAYGIKILVMISSCNFLTKWDTTFLCIHMSSKIGMLNTSDVARVTIHYSSKMPLKCWNIVCFLGTRFRSFTTLTILVIICLILIMY